eukprot:3938470-Rhodomonas_salina.1
MRTMNMIYPVIILALKDKDFDVVFLFPRLKTNASAIVFDLKTVTHCREKKKFSSLQTRSKVAQFVKMIEEYPFQFNVLISNENTTRATDAFEIWSDILERMASSDAIVFWIHTVNKDSDMKEKVNQYFMEMREKSNKYLDVFNAKLKVMSIKDNIHGNLLWSIGFGSSGRDTESFTLKSRRWVQEVKMIAYQ